MGREKSLIICCGDVTEDCIDIHNEVYLIPLKEELAHAFHITGKDALFPQCPRGIHIRPHTGEAEIYPVLGELLK